MRTAIDGLIEQLHNQYTLQAVLVLDDIERVDAEICAVVDAPEQRASLRLHGRKLSYQLAPISYYEQLIERDDLAIRRFSHGQALFDPQELAAQLITRAQAKRAVYTVTANPEWLQAQWQQVEQQCDSIAALFAARQQSEALMLAATTIVQLVEILRRQHHQLPLSATHMLRELHSFDEQMVTLIEAFWQQPSAARMQQLCRHVATE